MNIVKVQHHTKDTVLRIPDSIAKEITAEYMVVTKENGVLIFTPIE